MMGDVYAKYVGGGAFVNGVPARDLTKDEWDALDEGARARALELKLHQVGAGAPIAKRLAKQSEPKEGE
jgi:hypothetical protein